MKCQKIASNLIFAILFSVTSVMSGLASADGQIITETPNEIEEGGIIPIYIRAKGFIEDPISEVNLVIDGNPNPFKKALSVHFKSYQTQFVLGTRIRISALGKSKLSVVTKHLSGKLISKDFQSGVVLKGVDFSNLDTLNVTYAGGYKYPTDVVGQAQKMARPDKEQTGNLFIASRMHHPMLPPTNGDSGFFIKIIEFFTNEELIATYHCSAALSNDPYVSLSIPTPALSNTTQVIWKDNRGNAYATH